MCPMRGNCLCRSPYHLSGRVGQYHRLAVFLAQVAVPLEDGKYRVAGNRHEAFVVPPFPDLPGHKGMAKVVKVQVRQASIPARGLERNLLPSVMDCCVDRSDHAVGRRL